MSTDTQKFTIEPIDLHTISEDDIVRANAFSNKARAEREPNEPPRPVELTRAQLRSIPPSYAVFVYWIRDENGDPIAEAEAGYMRVKENAHLLDAGIHVLKDHRRQGIGRALAATLADLADAENRSLIMTGTTDRVPAGEAFATRVGCERGQEQHVNTLVLSEIDAGLMDRWVKEGPGRAPGYSLIAIDGRYPDDLVEQISGMHNVMNTAPRDGLQMEDHEFTVEQVREWEQSIEATGSERWSLFIRHDDSQQFVGFTEVIWNPKVPHHVNQMGTAVRPEHRGFALGKWLKAAMLQRVLADRSQAVEVRTGNADSNDAMLGINTQLGFKPYMASTVWQVPVETVRAYLGSSV